MLSIQPTSAGPVKTIRARGQPFTGPIGRLRYHATTLRGIFRNLHLSEGEHSTRALIAFAWNCATVERMVERVKPYKELIELHGTTVSTDGTVVLKG